MNARLGRVGYAAVMAALFAVTARAVEDCVVTGMAEKGSRGLANLASGWFEIPMQIHKGYNAGIPSIEAPAGSRSLGALQGLFRGVFHAVGRTAWGAVELAGFWTRNPTGNEHLMPLLDGNYAWEQGTKKPFRCPDVDSGINRVGMRFERGIRNVTGAVPEIPGQFLKADGERRVYIGLPKGIWFAGSRIVYGVADAVLFPFAGPENNLGVPFEEVEGWDALAGKYYNNVK
jgi:putative exosortase-associated protein (TIGR04073 family)